MTRSKFGSSNEVNPVTFSRMKGFLQLTTGECLQVYAVVEKNAADLYLSADHLADKEYYGPAISLRILGAEEYIKSFCLFLEGKGLQLRKIKGVRSIFSRHTSRHALLRDFFSVWLIAKNLLLPLGSSRKKIASSLLTAALETFSSMGRYKWWQNADQLKQNGLYVDFRNSLVTPFELTKEDYLICLKHTRGIPTEMADFIERINQMDNRQLKEFHKLFHDAQLEDLITDSIQAKK